MANIKKVVGYDRDGRGFLLSDKLLPVKERGKFVPSPIVKYYMGLSQYLGSKNRDLSLKLFVTDAERRVAELVHSAFDGVTLGDGVGLFEGQGLDDYADAATRARYRAKDEKEDWS